MKQNYFWVTTRLRGNDAGTSFAKRAIDTVFPERLMLPPMPYKGNRDTMT